MGETHQELIKAFINEGIEVCRMFPNGRYAVAVGGSLGKGVSDISSDIDFRLYYDELVEGEALDRAKRALSDLEARSRARGIEIDGIWPRSTREIDRALAGWVDGTARPVEMMWTVFGYHLPTDIYHQLILDDPYGIAAGWKALLTPYPPKLKKALIDRHMGRLRYWRGDYHFRNKVSRRDIVFLASLTASLMHDAFQVIYAINEVFYPGDGSNLKLAENFAVLPPDFQSEVCAILYPGDAPDAQQRQYDRLCALIDAIDALVKSSGVQ